MAHHRRHRRWIDPADPLAYPRLLADVAGSGRPPCRGVVHLWALDTPSPDGAPDGTPSGQPGSSLLESQRQGSGAALHLVQAIARGGGQRPPRLWLVTRGAVMGGAGLAEAPLWGFGRVVAQEHHELGGDLVDLDPESPPGEAGRLFDQLWSPPGEDQVAFRAGRKLLARLVRHQEDDPAGRALEAPLPFRSDASYLITGGLGGLGLEVARWMVRQGARRLILLGRSALPARAGWTSLDAESPAGRAVAAIRDLEALGASVHPPAVDVADGASLQSFLESYRPRAGPLSGASSTPRGSSRISSCTPWTAPPWRRCCAPSWRGPGTCTSTWKGSPWTSSSSSPPSLPSWALWGRPTTPPETPFWTPWPTTARPGVSPP